MNKPTSYFVCGVLVGMVAACGLFATTSKVRRASESRAVSNTVLKLGHSLDQNHPVHRSLMFLAERLAEFSGGQLQVEIFPNSQLGSETESIEQVQRGALAMTKTSTAAMEGFAPQMAVFSVPYLFRDEAHFWKIAEGEIGRRLLQSGIAVGVRGLCYFDAGSRNFYTIDRAVLTPDDLVGLKIRVQKSKTAMDMVEILGGSPTPIAWGELYTALQQSMVDGAENNPPSFLANRHCEVCKHLTMDEHSRVPDILLISEKVWRRLSNQEQQWVQRAADEAAEFQRTLWKEESELAIATVQREGVTVHYPDKTAFAAKVAPMHESLRDTPLGDVIKQIQQD